jgi:hypothetical protein
MGTTCNVDNPFVAGGLGIFYNWSSTSTYETSCPTMFKTITNRTDFLFGNNVWYDINITLNFDTGNTTVWVNGQERINGTLPAGMLAAIKPNFRFVIQKANYRSAQTTYVSDLVILRLKARPAASCPTFVNGGNMTILWADNCTYRNIPSTQIFHLNITNAGYGRGNLSMVNVTLNITDYLNLESCGGSCVWYMNKTNITGK